MVTCEPEQVEAIVARAHAAGIEQGRAEAAAGQPAPEATAPQPAPDERAS